jgi:hypothetical protein
LFEFDLRGLEFLFLSKFSNIFFVEFPPPQKREIKSNYIIKTKELILPPYSTPKKNLLENKHLGVKAIIDEPLVDYISSSFSAYFFTCVFLGLI